MSKGISKKRLEMGEEKWQEHQKERHLIKHKRWVDKNKDKIINNNKKRASYATGWRIRAKQKLIQYKGGKCCKCGYDKNIPRAYDFHHRDPKEKEFSVSKYQILNLDKLKKEVDKCDLVCKNCHAEIHDINDREKREEILIKHDEWVKNRKERVDKECDYCGKEFHQTTSIQRFCGHKCHDMFHRKVKERPSKYELKEMIDSMTMVAIGKRYGVSDNAIRKWARKYDLIK